MSLIVFAGDPSRTKTEDLESAAFREALDKNTVAPLLLARDVALAMRERRTRGAIVLLSSMQGTHPFEGSLAYGTSKAALIHGARILAKDFGGVYMAPGIGGAYSESSARGRKMVRASATISRARAANSRNG